MRRLPIRPQARVDLLEIWHYIAADRTSAADLVMEELEAAIRRLLDVPGIGHRRADVRDKRYRFWTVFSFVIAYRYDEETLTVVRVLHGRRDIRALLAT